MSIRVLVLSFIVLVLTACGTAAPTAEPTAAPAAQATNAPAAPTTAAAAPTTAAPTTAAAEPTTAAPTTEAAANATAPAAAAGGKQVFAIIPSESTASYEVGEIFINRDNQYNLAIGVTQEISGEITLDRSAPKNSTVGPITIDISAFKSDSERRDSAIRDRWLESARFPLAVFTPTQIEGLPDTYTDGTEVTLQITGDLTIRDTTKPVVFEVKGTITGEEMKGAATTKFKMSDFGFEAPNILNVLKAEDDVTVKFDFVARPKA